MSTSFTNLSGFTAGEANHPPLQRMSEEQFVGWIARIDAKAEWVDGEIQMMSPANWEHTSLRRWLDDVMTWYVAERNLGTVGDDTLVRLGRLRRLRIPDIFFVRRGREAIITATMLTEPPDLVVEIVSPDSAARDWREKHKEYEAQGITEYWVIDPRAESFEVYVLDDGGRYQGLPVEEGIIRSTVLAGFWLRSEWFASESRPSVKEVLQALGVVQ